MSNKDTNIEKKSFEAFVNAIGSEIEQAQVRLISAANAQMLFHYWKMGNYILYHQNRGAARSSRNWRKRYGSIIPKRKDIRNATLLICANSQGRIH